MQGVKNITLAEALDGLEYPRKERVHKYSLAEILFTAFAGMLCGVRSYVSMAKRGEHRLDLYREYLPFSNGIPSAWTLRNVISRLDPGRMHEVFAGWMISAVTEYRSEVERLIAMDGKQAGRTKGTEQKPMHVVSAYDSALRHVIGQIACSEKSNAITAIPELLDLLDIEDALITIDAMGTQHAIVDAILDKGGDYLLTVKKNRKVQYRELEEFFSSCTSQSYKPSGESYAVTRDAEHGRYEVQECWVCDDVSSLKQTSKWEGISGAAALRYHTERNGKTTDEIQYVIFSREGMSAQAVLDAKRKHWGIENGLHWVLDMTFREDESRARHKHSAENLNVIRHMAFNVLRSFKDKSDSFESLQLDCELSASFFNRVMESIGFVSLL